MRRRRQIYRLTELSGDVASGDILYEHSSIFDDGIVDRAVTSAFVVSSHRDFKIHKNTYSTDLSNFQVLF